MNRYLKLLISIAVLIAYMAALRFVLPADQPYFIMGIGIVCFVSWLLGTIPGLITAMVLIPLTNYVYSQFQVTTNYSTFASSPAFLGVQILIAVMVGHLRRGIRELRLKRTDLEEANNNLQSILSQVQEIGGLYNLCSSCKKIQRENGNWQSVDTFLKEQTKMEFSHCICPDCAAEFYESGQSKDEPAG